MKDLIITALHTAFSKLDSQIPQTKQQYIDVRIDDVKPINLIQFMKDNNIPDNAEFDVDESNNPILSYQITVPTTDTDKLYSKKAMFDNIAFRNVYLVLTKNGYRRANFSSALLQPFRNDNKYDLYANQDFDRLVDYYSLYFKKQ